MTTPAVNDKTDLTQVGYQYTYRLNGNNTVDSGTNRPFAHRSRQRPESSSTKPNPNGYRVPTPWNHNGSKFSFGSISIGVDIPNPTNVYRHIYTGNRRLSCTTPLIGGWDDFLYQQSINGALEKLKSQNVNVGQVLAEQKRTADLFSSTANRISKSISKLRRARRGQIWSQVKKTVPGKDQYPDEYLKATYGWTPLLQDVDGACRELAGLHERVEHPFYVLVKKFVRSDQQDTRPVSWARITGGTTEQYRLVCNHRKREGCNTVLAFKMNVPSLQRFSSLGLTNPAALAWEVLPFSFVYDWMHPVGSWLNLLDADFGWTFLKGCVTRQLLIEENGSHFEGYPANTYLVDGNPTSLKRWQKRTFRTVLNSSPWPVYPQLRNPFTESQAPKRIAVSLSLLLQRLT